MNYKKKINIGNLFLVIISIIITLVIVEALSRMCVWIPKKHLVTFKEWQIKNLPLFPYREVTWYNKEFLKEQNECHRWFVPEGKNYAVNLDFSGTFINYVQGRRVTTDQPIKFKHTVYIFGGSTVACEQVPDKYTIASYLQRLLNITYPGEYKVVNYGAASHVLIQQKEKFDEISPRRGDIVIFYDGYNDVFQSLYNGDPDGTIISNK